MLYYKDTVHLFFRQNLVSFFRI